MTTSSNTARALEHGQHDLFSPEHVQKLEAMVHRQHLVTEVKAAEAILPKLLKLHRLVLEQFRIHGAMNDEQLERLPIFSKYGPSTIRKRRSELYGLGELVLAGESTNSRGLPMHLWDLPSRVRAAA